MPQETELHPHSFSVSSIQDLHRSARGTPRPTFGDQGLPSSVYQDYKASANPHSGWNPPVQWKLPRVGRKLPTNSFCTPLEATAFSPGLHGEGINIKAGQAAIPPTPSPRTVMRLTDKGRRSGITWLEVPSPSSLASGTRIKATRNLAGSPQVLLIFALRPRGNPNSNDS